MGNLRLPKDPGCAAVLRGQILRHFDAKSEHEVAWRVLAELWNERTGVLTAQVLQDVARLLVNSYAIWCTETTPAEISAAFRIEDESQIGFWDALIVASALKCGAHRILSEDLNSGQTIAGVTIPGVTIPGVKIENPCSGSV